MFCRKHKSISTHPPSVLTSRQRWLLLPLDAPHPGVPAGVLYAGRTCPRRRSRTNSRYPKGSVLGKSTRAPRLNTLLPGLSPTSQATIRKSFALLIPRAQNDTMGRFHCVIISEMSSHSAIPWKHRPWPTSRLCFSQLSSSVVHSASCILSLL